MGVHGGRHATALLQHTHACSLTVVIMLRYSYLSQCGWFFSSHSQCTVYVRMTHISDTHASTAFRPPRSTLIQVT